MLQDHMAVTFGGININYFLLNVSETFQRSFSKCIKKRSLFLLRLHVYQKSVNVIVFERKQMDLQSVNARGLISFNVWI